MLRVAAHAAALPADPGAPAPDVAGYHARGNLPGRCGKPALYRWGGGEIKPIPSSSLAVPARPVFATDARDRHLINPPPRTT